MKPTATLLIALLLVGAAFSQNPKPAEASRSEETPTIKLDVDLVNLHFAVRDRKGALIPSLTKEDFLVSEDGKPQQISYFARETQLPLTIGLLVDVSRSQENLIETERDAASRFFRSVIRDKDLAFVISFGSDCELLQDSTSSTKLLDESLRNLRVIAQPVSMHPGPVPTANRQKGTLLYDAVYLAADEKLKREAGRKAIVVITDGMDYGSRSTLEEAITFAHKADTIVYGIYYSDPRFYPGSDSSLKKMANETGGRVFHVGRKDSLNEIFQQIQDEMRNQYTIAYTPTNQDRDGRFRKIEIKTQKGDYKVQARKGYFAASGERAPN